jgi:Flp pilus assembly protein TadD
VRYLACILIASGLTGCASRSAHGVEVAMDPNVQAAAAATRSADTLETFMTKMRQLSAEARPEPRKPLGTVESLNPALRGALVAATLNPTPDTYRALALEYRAVGVFDKAYDYLRSALVLLPQDPETYDALARLWRDSGFASVALGDAYRAAFYAPNSAAIHNTLGTVLQALGRRALARAEYERAVRLDPAAAYAFNNLCYGWVLEGEAQKAVSACNQALAIDARMPAAHNNLALAYSIMGDTARAQQAFAVNGDRATQLYNSGIVLLARRQYNSAVEAFMAAHAALPTMTMALARANQAAAQLNAQQRAH